MNYPKKLMTITELTKFGYTRHWLDKIAHAKGAPVLRTSEKGKHYFIMDQFEAFAKKYGGTA